MYWPLKIDGKSNIYLPFVDVARTEGCVVLAGTVDIFVIQLAFL